MPKPFQLRPRRAVYLEPKPLPVRDLEFYEDLDLAYRTLCAVLFNFVPTSGHPGGSVSSGRIVAGLLFESMRYDLFAPERREADRLSYAAGHKALGLYAMWALRNELARQGAPALLPSEDRQLRLEDLLGFRRNPTQPTPLFRELKAKALDGHPTPATPFVSLATGASGVGVTASLGLALGARELYGAKSPVVHILEGEGGMTPGRVHEALSAAATMGLSNAVLHLDWNQASIDSNRVTGEGAKPGDYVPWDPRELLQVHDWNVVFTPAGHDFKSVLAAQKAALSLRNGQPTAVVYRTTKGWRYGVEGRASHGAGHPFGSEGYLRAVAPFEARFGVRFPVCADKAPEAVERAFWDTLCAVREGLSRRADLSARAGRKLERARARLEAAKRAPRSGAPRLEALYQSSLSPERVPQELVLPAGKPATLRGALGKALGHLNKLTGGAVLGCAADLLESTSVSELNAGFPAGFWHARKNPGSRLIAAGGICEDAMGGMMAGLASFGGHIGVASSYAAFIGALQHVPARLHCIGQQARRSVTGEAPRTWIMVNAHAGPKTGEDGSTHADPQALQLLQDNFPRGLLITLTPWDPQEVWPLLVRALLARPAVVAPFVTRPPEPVYDRAAHGLPPAHAAAEGVYALRRGSGAKTVVLQGSGVANAFVKDVLPRLSAEGLDPNVYYVASAELFDLLPEARKAAIFPAELAADAMGITDFTLATLGRWVRSEAGWNASLHPFKHGGYLGSGSGDRVLAEGGLDGAGQLAAIRAWCRVPAAV